MSLSTVIAKIGTNAEFIAFNAHAGIAGFVVLACHGNYWVAGIGAVAAMVKEFWFDATFEQPKQTFLDNLTDTLGYFTGIAAGLLASHF